ncbi:glycogen debranching protein GlgX [Sphingobium sufflavum]|uniref:glycogen debranching protein GlgX n=1 Tax=Sphingobium sufflavum TaxID=1129547 RepID=UPI001F20839F|nr:glycogen debranching protein GlgX [Sphingobium sufflavum]MCE7795980.1 glycogen debranching protein GlgX [Sphingobium sufflavum]
MSLLPERLDGGTPYPLGVSFDGLGVNFAVFSANATRIELCLFDPGGRKEIARFDLPECTDEVWHGFLPHARPGLLYGYRAHGPYEPENGHRFNPNKLLIDPYARKLSGALKWTDALHGYPVRGRRADLGFDKRDSAPAMPKSVVTHDSFDWSRDVRPNTPWSKTVLYEAHAKGLTKLLEDVPAQERGTFAGLAHPRVIDHLHRLGVTALELMPIHSFTQDRYLQEKGLRNYWGYNSLNFFTPEPSYFASDTQDELRVAVRRLHAAGIEVILDVVYNHSCEGSELGPTLCWRGLDNATYYSLLPDDRRYCLNETGTGNTFNLGHARVIQMVADSLRYWATSFGIDGFRFDLGLTLGRTPTGFDPSAGFFDVLRQDPILGRLKLITEPWDVGMGGYQLGNFPPGFAEWNDKYRDTVRKYWRGDPGQRGDLAARLSGSGDLFDRRARRPWASVNFLTSHDGYTLADMVAYEERHNEANGEDNGDGHDNNLSRNWGAEGPTDDPGIVATRARVQRSLLLTLFASLGTPMLVAGDEFGRTQGGNNNAYCQDNAISWLDWSLLGTEAGAALTDFTARIIALRRDYPVLRAPTFLYGQDSPGHGVGDIEWWDERGQQLSDGDWGNPDGRALSMRRAIKLDDGRVEAINLLLNASDDAIHFALPGPFSERSLLVDSARPELVDVSVEGDYTLEPHSAVLIRSLWALEGE